LEVARHRYHPHFSRAFPDRYGVGIAAKFVVTVLHFLHLKEREGGEEEERRGRGGGKREKGHKEQKRWWWLS